MADTYRRYVRAPVRCTEHHANDFERVSHVSNYIACQASITSSLLLIMACIHFNCSFSKRVYTVKSQHCSWRPVLCSLFNVTVLLGSCERLGAIWKQKPLLYGGWEPWSTIVDYNFKLLQDMSRLGDIHPATESRPRESVRAGWFSVNVTPACSSVMQPVIYRNLSCFRGVSLHLQQAFALQTNVSRAPDSSARSPHAWMM